MRGTSAEILLPVSFDEVKTSSGYLGYMFGGMQGYIYRVLLDQPDRTGEKQSYQQTYHHAPALVNQPFDGVSNCFVSMNTYWRSRNLHPKTGRDDQHVKRLNACYADLDFYKLNLTLEQTLAGVWELIEKGIIPRPTFIIFSGKGLYLIYKLRNEDVRAMSRWSAIQHYLVDALKDLGADSNCTDAARILRVPGTINGKNGETVTVLGFNDVSYSIYELHKNYAIKPVEKKKQYQEKNKENRVIYPFNHATEKQRKFVRDLAKRLNLTENDYPDFTDFQATNEWIQVHKALVRPAKAPCYKTSYGYNLTEYNSMRATLDGYCKDIFKLLQMRKIKDSYRETGFFMIRRFLLEMGYTKEQALSKIKMLNASLDCPLEEKEITDATASAEKKDYFFRRSTIIKKLAIQTEELERLSFLGAESKTTKEYRQEANRRAYESRLAAEGKVMKKDIIRERRASIQELQERGMTAAEIQEKLQISKATFYRDIAAIATTSALEAAEEVVKETVEQVIEITEKATEAVCEAVQTVKKAGLRTVIRAALLKLKNSAMGWLSHYFSTPIIEMNCKAVLRGTNLPERYITRPIRHRIIRTGDRSSGDDPEDSPPLVYPKK